MPSPLLLAPPEIVEEIILLATAAHPAGPPSSLYALQVTCRHLHRTLHANHNPRLFAGIYMQMFGDAHRIRTLVMARDRTGDVSLLSQTLAVELQSRLGTMQVFRDVFASLDIGLYDPKLPDAFLQAYLMLLQDPASVVQLRWARAYEVCLAWLKNRLHEGALANNGWPVENVTNALVVSLFWSLDSRAAIGAESQQLRAEVLELLQPFVQASFRYPCGNVPDHVFEACASSKTSGPDAGPTTGRHTAHGAWPPTRLAPIHVAFVGLEGLVEVPMPSIALYAIPAYFARLAMTPMAIPSSLPRTRAEAIDRGYGPHGVTIEDIIAFNEHAGVRFPDAADFRSETGLMVAPSLSQLRPTNTPRLAPYILGSITGSWRGSYAHLSREAYTHMLEHRTAPAQFPRMVRKPIYITFQEHYNYSPGRPIPLPLEERGFANAWLPDKCVWRLCEDHIEFSGVDGDWAATYRTYEPGLGGREDCHPQRNAAAPIDVVVTGKTSEDGLVWNPLRFYGRVRPSDGRVTLVAEASDPERSHVGRWIYTGYVTASGNFVGRMMFCDAGIDPPPWDGVFCLSKV
ncbi:hypothetical protein PUNSTDRAFT_137962 [Punctularia strigosozonata HHB-11173 SS5]|uniref:F-box domain-containing protein n=1 Tax=Punctularia strigosozonata (strain HHB-11173) TaxID=741275 RepID=R7S4X0_PUNST|nr:uncharacterized protein PUNSTDRAFT_137962 [Punctularia strigosozonata HHB-11173 SS5]EIN05278.1 hypothetical protein PUNSTDRAFT_137962 [Punctularia strigosozonata HHB-11173 SS5]